MPEDTCFYCGRSGGNQLFEIETGQSILSGVNCVCVHHNCLIMHLARLKEAKDRSRLLMRVWREKNMCESA